MAWSHPENTFQVKGYCSETLERCSSLYFSAMLDGTENRISWAHHSEKKETEVCHCQCLLYECGCVQVRTGGVGCAGED